MTTPSIRRSTASFKAIDLPDGFAEVEDLMRLMVKAIRAQQLYLPNNPMHKQSLDALRAGFTTVWAKHAELVLAIGEMDVRWSNVPVLSETTKSSDNLPWLFFKDGIRELRFMPGIEDTEIVRLLEIINRARKASVEDDDLVTMLWEAELGGLTYGYMDLQQDEGEPAELLAGGASGTPASPDDVRANVEASTREEPAGRGVVNMADFDATIHFLDEREADYLRGEIAREYEQDLRTNIVAALLDVFEQQTDDAVREEVLDHVETMLAFMLASGAFRGVAYLLGESAEAAQRAGDLSPAIQSRIVTLADRLSAPDAVGQLIEALDDAPSLPAREELALLFDRMKATALEAIFAWLPRVRRDELRTLMAGLADRLAEGNTIEIVRLVESSDVNVSTEAVRRAGALKAQAAVSSISRVLNDADPRRRQIAAQALADIASTGAMQALERCVTDSERDIRILAARSLALRGHRPALARLEPIVRSKEIRAADITEKTAFFESYGAVCGDGGVAFLDGILNARSLLGGREASDMRAAASAALGRVGTPRAQECLQKAAGDKDPVVRNAVARALRGPSQ